MEKILPKPAAQRVAEIFTKERDRFLRFVERRLFDMDQTDAEDILSDVVLNLFRRIDLLGGIENLTAYIYRSLANRITDRRRQADPPMDAEVELSDGRTQPEQVIGQHELRYRLHAAINQLSDKERAVWIATEIDGRSFRELSEEWGEPIGTLLSRKSRATAVLRRLLSEYRDQ